MLHLNPLPPQRPHSLEITQSVRQILNEHNVFYLYKLIFLIKTLEAQF